MNRLLKTTALITLAAFAVTSPSFAQQTDPGAHMLEQWDADADGRVTIAEATTKRGEIFFMFDADSNGVLSAEEWDSVGQHMADEMQAKGAGHVMGQGMGQAMDGEDMAGGMGHNMGHGAGMGGGHAKGNKKGHGAGHGNGQGKGQQMGQGMGNGPGAVMHDAMSPAFNDADGNGSVTEAEFTSATAKLFPLLDRDGDGAVTSADFGKS